jgi:prepilin-type N-terminal cleavage/methylation domain-containing protein
MNKKGFTLIELLVVVAIIGILAAVGVVAYSGYTAGAKESACKANHKLIIQKVVANQAFCEFSESITLKLEYDWRNKKQGKDNTLSCSSSFYTIGNMTAISMTNYLNDPYNDEAWPYAVMSFNGSPPKNGYSTVWSYYGNPNRIRIQTKCRDKIIDSDLIK